MRRFLASVVLCIVGSIWLVENYIGRKLGLKTKDNCFTWAWHNLNYQDGDGIVAVKSKSGWFPHIALIKNLQSHPDQVQVLEYVPVSRVDKVSPPWRFDGHVVVTQYNKGTD